MLSSGMKVINKKLFLLFTIFIIFVLLLVGKVVVNYNEKKQYLAPPDIYYQKMLSSLKKSNEVVITDVFDFEFDKAYVVHRVSEAYGDQKYFLKVLNVNKKVYIPTLEYEGVNRIFFVKDNELVYDFIYETRTININELGETGVWISPDAILEMDLRENPLLKEDTLYINIK